MFLRANVTPAPSAMVFQNRQRDHLGDHPANRSETDASGSGDRRVPNVMAGKSPW
jgi:hypothetical protein